MTLPRRSLLLTLPWFRLAFAGLFLLSLGLRFWQLGQFNTLVFDEVYYPVFANRYLLGEPVYNAHPPLSQLLLAASMWLASHLPWGQDLANTYTGSLRSTVSYRWLNAVVGACLPLLVGAIAYHLTYRRSYALIAGLFVALDGLFLVESRYGLNNIYLVGLGLLGQLFVLWAVREPVLPALPRRQRRLRLDRGARHRWIRLLSDTFTRTWLSERSPLGRSQHLALAGLCFGFAAGIKWNGLGFLLGIYLVWAVHWLMGYGSPAPVSYSWRHPRPNFRHLSLWQVGGYLGLLPAIAYWASWQPHLWLNPQPGFWEMQRRILNFHQSVGSGPDVHPYCSPWYTWPLLWRPVAYFYHIAQDTQSPVPQYPELPASLGRVLYDVHAMGNPWLWWLSAAAIALMALLLLQQLAAGAGLEGTTALSLFLVSNYGANLLPWMNVSRCTFLYHYLSSLVFALLALAWMVDHWLQSPRLLYRQAGWLTILVAIAAFVFWLPIYLGLPLTPEGYRLRMWFPNWI